MKILLIQTAFIGDVILTTPLISAIKKTYPKSTLDVMVKPEAVSLLKDNPKVHELQVIDKKGIHRGPTGLWKFIRQIRDAHYDVLLSPHKSHRTGIISLFSRIPVRVGYEDAGLSSTAYTRHAKYRKELPEIQRLLEFFKAAFDLPAEERFPEDLVLFETKESKANAEAVIKEENLKNPVLIAASSVWPTKRWTSGGFADLIHLIHKKLGAPVALVGAPSDREISDRVISSYMERHGNQVKGEIKNLCGRTNLPGLYSLMLRSRILISNDSAPVHVACAARIPVVALFGPTVPSLGYAPLTPESTVAEVESLYCRPCGTHGSKKCPENHFLCMKLLDSGYVMKAVESVLDKKSSIKSIKVAKKRTQRTR